VKSIVKSNNVFTVIDLETSHFHPNKGAMIIEIAAAKIKDNKVIDKRTQLINPERKITQKITDLTSITNEMLEGKPVYREVLPKFYKFIEGSVVVAHNSQFDWDRFLLYFFKKLGIFPNNEVVDTLKLSRELLKLDSYKLGNICDSLGINHNSRHRALGDTLATAQLFLHLKNNYIDKNDDVQLSLTDNSNKRSSAKSQDIRKAAYWEKEVKNKKFQRLYITLDRSMVFYDIPTNSWECKSTKEPINFKDVEHKLLAKYNARNIEEVVRKIS
jgi:DNA polymerase-3 subunit alpha (Gram-positive type)